MAIQRRETKTGKVRWVARWRDKGGKEHSRTFDTKREAKTFLADLEVKQARGANVTPQKITVRDLFDDWLATRDIRPSTRESYEHVRDIQLAPLLDYPAAEVTPAEMMEWASHLRDGRPWISTTDTGLAESTVHTALVTVASAFKWGVQEGYLTRSPVRVPRKDKALDPVEIPTRAQIDAVIKRVETGGAKYVAKGLENVTRPNPAVADMMHIALWAGLRVSEIAGLVVGDVDLDAGFIHVRAQLSRDGKRRAPVKSHTSRRDVPIAPALVPVLRRLTVDRAPDEWLLVSNNGHPVQVSHAGKVVRYAAENVGAPGVHFHALRHFFVSTMLTAGVAVQDVAAVAGHTPATTLETYAHVLDGYRDRVSAAFEAPAFSACGISAGSRHLRAVD